MIFDTLDNAHRYFALNPHFEAAFRWLRENPDSATEREEIDGDACFVMIQTVEGRGKADPLLEAHNRYLDIHVTLGGVEEIGWKARATCQTIQTPYSDETDAATWQEAPDFYVPVKPGQFVIVFPEDAHAPMSASGTATKAVFKILV